MGNYILTSKEVLLLKLSYERSERYVSSVRAIVHIDSDTAQPNPFALESMHHTLDLLSKEIKLLARHLDETLSQASDEDEE